MSDSLREHELRIEIASVKRGIQFQIDRLRASLTRIEDFERRVKDGGDTFEWLAHFSEVQLFSASARGQQED